MYFLAGGLEFPWCMSRLSSFAKKILDITSYDRKSSKSDRHLLD